MSTVAYDRLWPRDSEIFLRAVFFYTGQGESTLLFCSHELDYKTVLIDINLDRKNGGIDVPLLMKELLQEKQRGLDIFVNTHPHSDHLSGLASLEKSVTIQDVWHSGHRPGKDHDDAYKELRALIEKVNNNGGEEVTLQGSREEQQIGDVNYYVLSPAEYVTEDIEDCSGEERYRRIHEQCSVLRFGKDENWIMISGDSDRDAWEKHITSYHEERLRSQVLSASHHGSRTFFRYKTEDEPYLAALESIAPEYVVVSAPKEEESPFDHPHADALELYADEVSEDNILHTGESRLSFICDVFCDGEYQITDDSGDLVEKYGLREDDPEGNDTSGTNGAKAVTSYIGTRVDERPMGSE